MTPFERVVCGGVALLLGVLDRAVPVGLPLVWAVFMAGGGVAMVAGLIQFERQEFRAKAGDRR